jgi:hypothetical protein
MSDQKTDVQLMPDVFEQALDPDCRYFDATALMIEMARRMQGMQEQIDRLEELLKRTANVTAKFAKRQVEMRADLLEAGAFDKKSPILRPGDMN